MQRTRKPPTTRFAEGSTAGPLQDQDHRPRGVLADDHAIVTDGLRHLLEDEYAIVAVVADGKALVEAARLHRPDFVIADISMPLLNGLDAIRAIRKELPQVAAICLTMHFDRMYVAEALAAGAAGFVAKHAAATELHQAIRTVLRGGSYVSPQAGGRGPMRGRPFSSPDGARELFKLTLRQRQVLQLIAEGRTVRQVATLLDVVPKTVEFHKYRIMAKLGVESSAAMIQFAVRHGMDSG